MSFAGPGVNIALALVFSLIVRLLPSGFTYPVLFEALLSIVRLNLLLGIFNLVPIPPLDGSHILFSQLPASLNVVKLWAYKYGFYVLMALMLFHITFPQYSPFVALFVFVSKVTQLLTGI